MYLLPVVVISLMEPCYGVDSSDELYNIATRALQCGALGLTMKVVSTHGSPFSS